MAKRPEDSAWFLARLTWRRDFWRDDQLRQRAFKEEIATITRDLRKKTKEVASLLHPQQTMSVEKEPSLALFLREKHNNEPLAVCHVDTSESGILRLQVEPRNLPKTLIELVLDCSNETSFYWRNKNQPLDLILIDFLFQLLFQTASNVLRSEQPPLDSRDEALDRKYLQP